MYGPRVGLWRSGYAHSPYEPEGADQILETPCVCLCVCLLVRERGGTFLLRFAPQVPVRGAQTDPFRKVLEPDGD